MKPGPWSITTFYHFFAVEDPQVLATNLRELLAEGGMVGLVIVASEGVNGTVAGPRGLAEFKERVQGLLKGPLRFKDSTSVGQPFRRAMVDVRREIVTLKLPTVVREGEGALDADAWDEWLRSDRPKLLIDARNRYETEVGKFRGALDPQMDRFSQWPEVVRGLEADRTTPILIYCTGGIRCEKAAVALREEGFREVYQLQDGILGYFEQRPEGGEFEGECFVFDERVAVDATLRPSQRFTLCSGCGRPILETGSCQVCAPISSVASPGQTRS